MRVATAVAVFFIGAVTAVIVGWWGAVLVGIVAAAALTIYRHHALDRDQGRPEGWKA